jgi:ATP-binding cassette subfamily C (CFTR/MRP) protein 4
LGHILLDGEDISSLGLDFVRKALAVIPQTSFIFKGSLRYNIDPINQVEDSLIISTLDEFDLYDLLVPENQNSQNGSLKVKDSKYVLILGF